MTIWRPSIAAGTIGQSSFKGRVASTIPPECCEAWRGSPHASRTRRASAFQRVVSARFVPTATSTSASKFSPAQPSTERATRSISVGGSPSALPSSRIAPFTRKVGNAHTSAERSWP